MSERIGKYEIREELGRGGMGQVFLGFDPTMDRLVAIKVLAAGDDSSQLIRFQTEATAAGNLNHKNIVTVYEFGEDRGRFFLAMQYLQGSDLQKIIDGRVVQPILDQVGIMTQVAEGLLCAHRGGVVHRDVKPANIIVLPEGSVKILDFGIARLTRERSVKLTQAGHLIGSVSYMAPEQFSEGGEADVLCDIWAYGTVYYELLTGRNPFRGPDPPSTMHRIMSVEPAGVRTLRGECPESLEKVITRLLAKDPEARYQSFEDVLFDTNPILLSLQKAGAARLVSEAIQRRSEGQIDEAQQLIRQALALEPMHAEARAILEQLQGEARTLKSKGRIEIFRRKAEDALAKQDYSQAIEALGSALRVDPSDTHLRSRLADIQRVQEQRQKADRLLAQAQKELEAKQFTSAFRSAQEAVNADPQNTGAQEILSHIGKLKGQRDAELRLRDGITKARGLLVVDAIDEAIALLEGLQPLAPDHPRIQELLDRAIQEREARQRRTRLDAGTEAARNAFKSGDFTGAIEQLNGLAVEFPNESSITELLSYAHDEVHARERAAKIKEVGNQAWAALRVQEFDRALDLVSDGLAQYPEAERLLRLQEMILSARSDHLFSETARIAMETADRLEQGNDLEAALQKLDSVLATQPANASLSTKRAELVEKIAQRDRKRRVEAIQEALSQARGMVEGGSVDSATSLLSNATAIYPNEPELASLLTWAREEQLKRRQEAAAREIVARVEALEKRGAFAEALEAAELGIAEHPESTSLADAVKRLRSQVQRERDLAELSALIARKDLTAADRLLVQVRERNPGDEALARLAEQIRQGQRDTAIDLLCAEAQRLLDVGELNRAEETVRSGLQSFGRIPKLVQMEGALNSARRAGSLESARRFYQSRDWAAAERAVREVLGLIPTDREAAALLESIARENKREEDWKAREEARQAADRLIAEGRFAEAEAKLKDLMAKFPGDAVLAEDLRRASAAGSQLTRRKHYQQGREMALATMRAGQLEKAEAELKQLLTEFPGDAALEEDWRTLMKVQQEQERRETWEKARRKSGEHLARREFDAAIEGLKALLKRYPGDPIIENEVEAAVKAKALFEQRKSQDRIVEVLEKRYRKGDPRGLKEIAARLGANSDDARIRELLDWADTEIGREVADESRESASTLQDRRRKKRWMFVGGSLGTVAALGLIYVVAQPRPPASLSLDTSEISFNAAANSSEPLTQSVVLKGDNIREWSATASDPWLTASPQKGKSAGPVAISVDPSQLGPGAHSAELRFSTGDSGRTTLKVNVLVASATSEKPAEKQVSSKEPSPPLRNQKPESVQKPAPVVETKTPDPVPAPPTETPKPAPKIVDCWAPNFRGLREGTLQFNGDLAANGVLTIGEARANVAGGRTAGNQLPGCDVDIVKVEPAEVLVVARPSAENGFRTVTLQNKSPQPVANIAVQWSAKKP